MIELIFIINLLIVLIIFLLLFKSKLWYSSFPFQLILFILPSLVGFLLLIVLISFFNIQTIKTFTHYIHIYTSIILLILIPQFYKLSWIKLIQMRNKLSSEHRKIIFAAFLMMVMIVGMVFIFAIYFYWFSHIGNNQGLLSGLHNYENIRLLFTTSVYFSFVTYFTLGYGDLVPYGFWMKSFVFLECIMSILNTGLMFIYVYNFLFNNFTEPNDKTHPHKQSNNM